jgi:hypothetical protein
MRKFLPVLAALTAAHAFAQTAPTAPAEEEFIDEENELGSMTDGWRESRNKVSFGFRFLSSGADVKFGGLGNVPNRTRIPASQGNVTRNYDNGAVAADQPRLNESLLDANGNPVLDANGNRIQTSTPGGRYFTTVTDPNTGVVTITSDSLSHTPGRSRQWSYQTAAQAQARPGYIALSNFGAISEGATAATDQGVNGGMEMQLDRQLRKFGRKVTLALTAGVGLNDINAKAGGTVRSTLRTETDFFSLNGQSAPAAPYLGPTFGDLRDSSGNLITPGGLETTVPINTTPDGSLSTTTTVAGGATVQGNWQIQGAYFLLRVGPTITARLTNSIGLSASIGVAGAYAGSRYSVVERLEMTDVVEPITTTEESRESKFLPGYYADVNIEWRANQTTGLFGGVSVQQIGDYDQSVGGRTAKIDFGSAVGIRGGISIRF